MIANCSLRAFVNADTASYAFFFGDRNRHSVPPLKILIKLKVLEKSAGSEKRRVPGFLKRVKV